MSKLAVNGGSPVRKKPFCSWPVWDINEEKSLSDVVFSGKWGTLGPNAMEIASKFAGYIGVDYGIAVTSGTVALEIILRSLGIGYEDEVIVPAYTFAATVSAVAIVGGTPVFADIALPCCNIDCGEIEKHITKKTKAVIAVHIAGYPCDMENICKMAKKHNIYVIEDASHAHGAELNGRKIGSYGDAAVFSCQNSKNMTSGEGGIIVTNNKEIFAECWRYHNSGRTLEGSSELGGMVKIGTNARMTEFQACVLLEQLKRMPEQLKKRNENAEYLISKLKGINGLILPEYPGNFSYVHSWFLFQILLDEKDKNRRGDWINILNSEGIPVLKGYPNLTREKFLSIDNQYFRKSTGSVIDYAAIELPETEIAAESAMWLHGSVLLGNKDDMDDIANGLYKAAETLN